MAFSLMAMNRILERQIAYDSKIRNQAEASGRPLLSHGRNLSTEKLLQKLTSLGVDVDKDTLLLLCQDCVSAEELAHVVSERATAAVSGHDFEWLWICVVVLWDRWFPQVQNMEMVDDRMHEGYAALHKGNALRACAIWLPVWKSVLEIVGRVRLPSIAELDRRFAGSQLLSNWVLDLEMELGNAGEDNSRFHAERIRYCEEYIERFGEENRIATENMRRGLAESLSQTGEKEDAEARYRKWLEADPAWGGGWAGWSDAYWNMAAEQKQYHRAEQILKQGLAVPDLRDRDVLLERLFDLYTETGWKEQADKIKKELNAVRATAGKTGDSWVVPQKEEPQKRPVESAASDKQKARPNDPCPCGSGKKYKRCCGA